MKAIACFALSLIWIPFSPVSANQGLPQTPFERLTGKWVESGRVDGGKGNPTPSEKWLGKFSEERREFTITYEDGRQWVYSASDEDRKIIAVNASEKQKLIGTWDEKTDTLDLHGKDGYGRDKIVRIHITDVPETKTTVIIKDHRGKVIIHWVGGSKKLD